MNCLRCGNECIQSGWLNIYGRIKWNCGVCCYQWTTCPAGTTYYFLDNKSRTGTVPYGCLLIGGSDEI